MTVMQFFGQGINLSSLICRTDVYLYYFIHDFFSFCIRCCEYALLVLEHWPDAPEIQRSADLYEDLIRCCVADAMSEVYLMLYLVLL